MNRSDIDAFLDARQSRCDKTAIDDFMNSICNPKQVKLLFYDATARLYADLLGSYLSFKGLQSF